MINKNYVSLLTTPARRIKGKAELFSSSATSLNGDLLALNNVDVKEREAAVSAVASCYGKNLINYYTDNLQSYDEATPVFEGEVLNLSTTGYFFYYKYSPELYPWVKNGATYTFSEDVISYGDSADNPVTIALVCMYSDDTYTEHNKVITGAGRQYVTVTADATKEIKYIEVRPVRKGNNTTTLTAAVANLQLQASAPDDISYERYKNPVESVDGKLTLYAPNATVVAETAINVAYSQRTLANTFNYNDSLISIDIERETENKFFGFGVCQKLTVKLRDKDRLINITQDDAFKIYFNCGIEYLNNFPTFYVTDVARDENNNDLTITAYDLIYSGAAHTLEELGLTAYSIKDLAVASASLLGLELKILNINDTSFDTYFENGANFAGTESIREVWNDIAEATQAIYYATGDYLVFKRLDVSGNAVLTISKADYFTLESKGNRTLTEIVSATELGDNVSYSISGDGSIQYIRDNAFWDLREDRVTLLENAVAAVGGLSIDQVTCKWRGNYLLELGDKVNVVAKDGSIYTFYLLDDVINYNGGFNENSAWSFGEDAREHSNPTSLGEALKQTFAKVDKANKEIQLAVAEVNGYNERMSNIEMNTESITATVENLNNEVGELSSRVEATITEDEVRLEIQKELADGVDRVTTGTGFTFNEEGLHISKTGAEMETTITENGMIVYRDDTAILSADNTGVDAVNLRANTYLIIGVTSRFENYDNDSRTGCFWIG